MTDKIQPAMPPEEWSAQLARTPKDRRERLIWAKDEADAGGYLTIHGLAALCLYDRPFGFTRDDVKTLRDVSSYLGHSDEVSAIADKIATLLPPE